MRRARIARWSRRSTCSCPRCSPDAPRGDGCDDGTAQAGAFVRAGEKRDRKNALRLALVARGALLSVEG